MKTKRMPSKEFLDECLDYNEESGIFTWKKRPVHHFKNKAAMSTWNSRYSKTIAGNRWTDSKGKSYIIISMCGTCIKAHRLAFQINNIDIDDLEVDHENGDGTDNRWSNLRVADRVKNTRNARKRSDNKSGVTGVSWAKSKCKWVSNIASNGRQISLGSFFDKFEAIAARKSAEVRLGYHKNHGSDRPL